MTRKTSFIKRLGASGAGRSLTAWWKKNGRRGEGGSEVVEFAFCASLLLGFTFGFLELCLVLFTMNSVAEASRQAARWASVRGTTSSVTSNGVSSCANPNIATCPAHATDIQTYTNTLPGMSAANTTVTVNWCNADGVTGCSTNQSNAAQGNIVKVTVSYQFAPGFTLKSTAEKVIWQ